MKWARLRRLGSWWLIALGAVIGVTLTAVGRVREGGYLIGLSFLLAAGIRLVLPTTASGGIVVRRAWIDILTLLLLGVAVLVVFILVRL